MTYKNIWTGMAAIGIAAAWSAGAAQSAEKLHIVEAYCIDYEHSGPMMSGTSKECLRKWGMEQTTWENTSISMGAFSQKQNQRTISSGKTIVSFDPKTMQGTKTDNPYFEAMAGAAAETGPKEFADKMVSQLGFTANGETKNVAEETCNVYTGQMGSMCMTEDGLTLETNIAGMVKRATKVNRDSGGTDADYVIPEGITFTQIPDLGNFMPGANPAQ